MTNKILKYSAFLAHFYFIFNVNNLKVKSHKITEWVISNDDFPHSTCLGFILACL